MLATARAVQVWDFTQRSLANQRRAWDVWEHQGSDYSGTGIPIASTNVLRQGV
jgi:hypothetical protein